MSNYQFELDILILKRFRKSFNTWIWFSLRRILYL